MDIHYNWEKVAWGWTGQEYKLAQTYVWRRGRNTCEGHTLETLVHNTCSSQTLKLNENTKDPFSAFHHHSNKHQVKIVDYDRATGSRCSLVYNVQERSKDKHRGKNKVSLEERVVHRGNQINDSL
jgi:phospholipase/lecithinase/hemolysin